MMPSSWGEIPDKPICPTCGCIEFTEEFICTGCEEPLVVRPYPKKHVSLIVAADRWGQHWPTDYEKRCFICGWKSTKSIDSLIPKDPESLMAAGIWEDRPEAKSLAKTICPNRTLSQRFKTIIGILAHNGENALFRTAAHDKYSKLAQKYIDKKLCFCRKCAEADAKPQPIEALTPNTVSLTDTMANAMKEIPMQPMRIEKQMAPQYIPPQPPLNRDSDNWGSDKDEDWDEEEDEDLEEDPEDEDWDEEEEEEEEEDMYDEDDDGDYEEEDEEAPNYDEEQAKDWGNW